MPDLHEDPTDSFGVIAGYALLVIAVSIGMPTGFAIIWYIVHAYPGG